MENVLIYKKVVHEDEVSRIVEALHMHPYLFSLNTAKDYFKVGPLSLVSNRIVIGISGSFLIHYLNSSFLLESGDYLYLPSTALLYFESREKNSSIVSIDYDADELHFTDDMYQAIENEAIFIKALFKDDYYFQQFQRVNSAVTNKVTGNYILVRTVLEKIKMMEIDYRFHHGENTFTYKDKITQKEKVCRKCMGYIDEHIACKITIEEMAAYCHYTPNYIYKSFSECLACSTQHYILTRRLYLGLKQLRLTKDTVKKIAQDVGFSSEYHFSNAFKKEFGIAPGKYRKQFQAQ